MCMHWSPPSLVCMHWSPPSCACTGVHPHGTMQSCDRSLPEGPVYSHVIVKFVALSIASLLLLPPQMKEPVRLNCEWLRTFNSDIQRRSFRVPPVLSPTLFACPNCGCHLGRDFISIGAATGGRPPLCCHWCILCICRPCPALWPCVNTALAVPGPACFVPLFGTTHDIMHDTTPCMKPCSVPYHAR